MKAREVFELTNHGRFERFVDARAATHRWRAEGWQAQTLYVKRTETDIEFFTVVVGEEA
jgi:hypothetical protein